MDEIRADLTWQDVERLAEALAEHVQAAAGVAPFDRVVGIARGGLIPAALLAALLDVKRVETFQMQFYEGSSRSDVPRRVGAAPLRVGPSGDPARTLVVDEIMDSGETMRCVRELLPGATLAVLVARNAGTPVETTSGLSAFALDEEQGRVWTAAVLKTDAWILFPWSPDEDRRAREAQA